LEGDFRSSPRIGVASVRADKIDKPKVEDVHLWFGERIDEYALSVVDITVCAWINPPSEQITTDKTLVTCHSCIKRSK
jgi:hypothetical protein